MKIDAHLNKLCPATEALYSDEFYTKQDIIITALDNVEARRYVDRYVIETRVHKELSFFYFHFCFPCLFVEKLPIFILYVPMYLSNPVMISHYI